MERDPASGALTRFETDGSAQDNAAGLEALKIVFASPLPSRPSASAAVPEGIAPVALGVAVETYLAALKGRIPAKTLTQKRTAVAGFAQYKGVKVNVHAVSRTEGRRPM